MPIKTILVNLNNEARAPELIAAAAAIARPVEAHVAGLFVMPPLFVPSDIIMPMGADFYDEQVREHEDQAKRVKAVFDRLTSGEPYVAEWRIHGDARTAYASIAEGVIEQARSAELVIVSQAVDGKDSPLLTDIPERVALEGGRPVLVIPSVWLAKEYGHNVAVAWNDSREATRATFDALPFLERAKKIRLITVGEETDSDGNKLILPAEVAATLARHGLNVDVELVPKSGRHYGDAILARVAADGSDLLVMGAYGHSRMREFILGGATREVLKHMTVPVLMSH
jgi:nucleotide-binding universal stress UspA family protein